jgi:acetyl esterase/lipase
MQAAKHLKVVLVSVALTCAALARGGGGLAEGQANDAAAAYTRRSDVIYGRKDGLALTLEVFTPGKPNGLGVVWAVSSSGRSSREQTLQPSFERRVSPLLDHGYTVFAVVHGSSPRFQLQDQVDDIRRAVRFVRHHAGDSHIDGHRLAISGSSAGGLLALTVAMQGRNGDPASADVVERESSRIQAAGCFFSPTDLVNFGEDSQNIVDYLRRTAGGVDPTFQFYDVDAKTGGRTLIEEHDRVLGMLREFSPIAHVTADAPPTMLIHGDADAAVPIRQSRRLIERLTKANVAARLIAREGKGHAWPGWEADTALIADWFDRHLRPVGRTGDEAR